MRDALPIVLLLIVAPFAVGCQSNGTATTATDAQPNSQTPDEQPAAYLDGKAVTKAELYRAMLPAHGGEALAEILLDRAVKARLVQENITMTQPDIDAERDKLLASLADDPDQAARLLQAMRSDRGLDAKRFANLLRRNAGLRALVRDQITINDAAIRQAYQLRYGDRYRVRLITADKLDILTNARRQTLAGQSFTDLAIQFSTDVSASQGGLLSPINPADSTYPKSIRDALPKLKMDQPTTRLSSVIALDTGYALLWLEEVLSTDNPPTLTDVRITLETTVRADLERLRMRQLARTLIEQSDVVTLDPLLNKSWLRQEKAIQSP